MRKSWPAMILLWIVTTAASAPAKCVSFNGAVTLSCAAGRVCLAWFGEDPVCVDHTCGTGPALLQYIYTVAPAFR